MRESKLTLRGLLAIAAIAMAEAQSPLPMTLRPHGHGPQPYIGKSRNKAQWKQEVNRTGKKRK